VRRPVSDAAAEREWTLPMTDRRRALLIAALSAVRVNSRAQELVMLHAWLDTWSGLGAIVVGMQRHGRWHCRAPGAGSIVGLSVSSSLMKEGARDGCAHHARDGLWRS